MSVQWQLFLMFVVYAVLDGLISGVRRARRDEKLADLETRIARVEAVATPPQAQLGNFGGYRSDEELDAIAADAQKQVAK